MLDRGINTSTSNSAIDNSKSSMASNERNTMNGSQMFPRTLSPKATQRRTMSPNATMDNPSSPNGSQLMSAGKKNSMSDTSMTSERQPMISPSESHKDYQRFKYYSALRTGYAHLGVEQPDLQPPEHIIDKELFLFSNPFSKCTNTWSL